MEGQLGRGCLVRNGSVVGLRGPWGLYFILETEATERFMHEGISSDLPLEVADATGQQTRRG